jgi:hypothetical protein
VRRRTFKSVFLPRIAPAQRVGDAEGAEEANRIFAGMSYCLVERDCELGVRINLTLLVRARRISAQIPRVPQSLHPGLRRSGTDRPTYNRFAAENPKRAEVFALPAFRLIERVSV